jgi:nucleotidyltransferase/DNA polymerase involved in DNA repair
MQIHICSCIHYSYPFFCNTQDCFYVQVERGINPSLNGKPVAVSQYNPFGDLKSLKPLDNRTDVSNGSLIAVSYEARAAGVKRIMRGKEAKEVCPGREVLSVVCVTSKILIYSINKKVCLYVCVYIYILSIKFHI